jgi:hypothetical protein
MNALSRAQLVPEPDVSSYVPIVLGQMREHVERPLRARHRVGGDRFFDLHYADLVRDPLGQMRKLYDWAGDDLTPEVEQAMLGWLERNPQDRFGPRPYALGEYGVTRADLEPLFADYLSAVDVELEPAA